MTVPEIILSQLGGEKFALLTGSSNFTASKNTLCMDLAKNKSGATNLYVIYNEGSDTYIMKFIKYTPLTFSRKTYKVLQKEKTTIIQLFTDVYAEDLTRYFEQVTGLFTSLYPNT